MSASSKSLFGGVIVALVLNVARTPASDVVISQIYPGGGVNGSAYRSDFIELFNRGTTSVNLSGWSVQHGVGTDQVWQMTALNGTIAPGQYYLVQEFTGSAGLQSLPAADAVGTINLSSFAGRVALLSSTTLLFGACPTTNVADMVGYAVFINCYEGAPIDASLSGTQAFLRQGGGCLDSDNNFNDFRVAIANARNSASPTNLCALRGACCHDQTCSLETETACAGLNGAFQGSGSACAVCPARSCRTILQARALPTGTVVRICDAIVSSTADLSTSAVEKMFQLQDATAGISVRGSNAAIDQLLAQAPLGHSITVEGTLGQDVGLTLLVGPFTFVSDNGFVGVPAPQIISGAEFTNGAGESFESELVTVRCSYFVNDLGERLFFGNFYEIQDPAGFFEIGILTPELNQILAPDTEVTLTGILLHGSRYYFVPRTPADIVVSPECAPFGSCCLPVPECVSTIEAQCTQRAGTFRGAHTHCSDDPCHLPCFGIVRGDTNGDGVINLFDIDAFCVMLTSPLCNQMPTCVCRSDCNCDGRVDNFDIDPFVMCLTHADCPPCNP